MNFFLKKKINDNKNNRIEKYSEEVKKYLIENGMYDEKEGDTIKQFEIIKEKIKQQLESGMEPDYLQRMKLMSRLADQTSLLDGDVDPDEFGNKIFNYYMESIDKNNYV